MKKNKNKVASTERALLKKFIEFRRHRPIVPQSYDEIVDSFEEWLHAYSSDAVPKNGF